MGSVTDIPGQIVITAFQKQFSATPEYRQIRVIIKEGAVLCEKHQDFGYIAHAGTIFTKVPTVSFGWVQNTGSVVAGSIIKS